MFLFIDFIFESWFANLVLLVHISVAFFWLGWMIFLFFIFNPVASREIPDKKDMVFDNLTSRTRKFVFWMVIIMFITGIYNMTYRGFWDADFLFNTVSGNYFLVKLVAVSTLFGIYFTAPYLLYEFNPFDRENTEKRKKSIKVTLHVIAFISGIVAAYIGLTI